MTCMDFEQLYAVQLAEKKLLIIVPIMDAVQLAEIKLLIIIPLMDAVQ